MVQLILIIIKLLSLRPCYINGVILFLDTYPPSAAGAPTVSSGGTVTAANWRKMQLVGCVFLPAAGYHEMDNRILEVGALIRYWVYSTNYVRTSKIGTATIYYYRCLYGKWSDYTINTNADFAARFSTTNAEGKLSVRLVHNL